MSVFLITYDLVNENTSTNDYKPLWDEFNRLGAHRVQYSAWLINVQNTTDEIKNHFRKFLDKDDRLWITKLRRGQYTYVNAQSGTNAWLEKNPPEP